jgi:uncharacterized protein YjhX (UPF0386 family)
MFITKHQKRILTALKEGGRVISVYDELGWEHNLVDKDGNTEYTKGTTLKGS